MRALASPCRGGLGWLCFALFNLNLCMMTSYLVNNNLTGILIAVIAAINLDIQKSADGYIYGIPLLFYGHKQHTLATAIAAPLHLHYISLGAHTR